MSFLLLFLCATIILLLSYNCILTLFLSDTQKKIIPKKTIQILEKYLLGMLLLMLIFYFWKADHIPKKAFILPWIWGFLTGHLFFNLKKRWLHEFFGLGILLAITFILFIKQDDIFTYFNIKDFQSYYIEICIFYALAGIFLGAIFWRKN